MKVTLEIDILNVFREDYYLHDELAAPLFTAELLGADRKPGY